ncbi:hypothetical protein, partial [Arthrobacter sp. ZGTC212]|uniref:hypothetical protein n=1 Tax=Arthrobacter sp. ZGTC212 TaxID=2058899 RepID=UPI001CA54C7E
MKMRSYFVCKQGLRPLLGATTVLMAAVLLTGCNSPAGTAHDSAPAASASADTSAVAAPTDRWKSGRTARAGEHRLLEVVDD